MTFLVPVMLFGWIVFTIYLFASRKPHRAVVISVIGGWLLLPQIGWNLPGLPDYTKSTAIAFGLIAGLIATKLKGEFRFQWRVYDLPVIVYCLSPIVTSMSNRLGFYDGIASTYGEIMTWGIPYLAGRIYFESVETVGDLFFGLIAGGLLYVPLCLYEIRMSPQLSNMVYGFFPHSFLQHYRYGGYRPIVFLQHGLAVSLWMAITSTLAFWAWRSYDLKKMFHLPMWLVALSMMFTCVLCKSANGWIFLALGCGAYFLYRHSGSCRPFLIIILIIPTYIILRLTGWLPADELEKLAANIFDYERAASLGIRLYQEELFGLKALQRPLFGWGGHGRGWPLDPLTGEPLIQMIDSLWLITFSTRGFVGLVSFMGSMLIGPWLVFRSRGLSSGGVKSIEIKVVLLGLSVVFFILDTLVNAMPNPIFILISGALVSWQLSSKEKVPRKLNTNNPMVDV